MNSIFAFWQWLKSAFVAAPLVDREPHGHGELKNEVVEAPAPAPKKKPVHPRDKAEQAKPTKEQLAKLTKAQLEERGRELGVELDKRKKKADLVDQLHAALK